MLKFLVLMSMPNALCLVRIKQVHAIVQATVQLVVLLHVIGFVADGDEEENQMKL